MREKLTDSEILESIRKGEDQKVLSLLYKNVLPNVQKLITGNSGSKEDAHDIFQDAILIFYRQVVERTFNERYKIYGYVYTICRNLWINKAKRKMREIPMEKLEESAEEENILDKIINEEKAKQIALLFSKLDSKCIELLTYSVYHKMSMKEIAEKMKFPSENAAKTGNYRCKQKLAEILKETKASQWK